MPDASQIRFRRLAAPDLPLLHHWLNHTPAVNEFYAYGEVTYEQMEAKYGPRIRGESPTTPYLILYGDTPVGYIQTYRWRDYPEYAQYLDLQEEAAALDLFIGHPDYLHKGLGPLVLQGFLREVVFADPQVESCVLTAEVRNTGALRAYEKAGFAFLRIRDDIPDEPGPMWVLRIGRACRVPSRAAYLTAPYQREKPALDHGLLDRLPPEITDLTGPIERVSQPQQGVCNLLLQLHARQGDFALKVAQGAYRSQELWAEHAAMQALAGGPVPVPKSLLYLRQGELSFQLRPYVPGVPVTEMMDGAERAEAIRQLGRTLAAIHGAPVPRTAARADWAEWVDRSLDLATRSFAAGACDLEDFAPDRPPAVVLEWLQGHRPAGGSICLLHGDYRPKNLLWHGGQVSAVLDWAFVDVGDPYYDLSIFRYYMRDEQEWHAFLSAYGLQEFDSERFAFNMALHTFLNV